MAKHHRHSPSEWITIADYRGHYFLSINPNAYMGSSLYWHGWHHRWEIEYLEKSLRPNHVFVDAGANLGEFTIAAAGRVTQGRVISFEPHEVIRGCLERSVAMNKFSNVTILPYGLGAKDSEGSLFEIEEYWHGRLMNEGLSTQFVRADCRPTARPILIRSLDELMGTLQLERIDWMKVDVEGAEWAVLKGAAGSLQKFRPRLFLEIDHQNFKAAGYMAKDLLAWLARVGYRAYRFTRSGKLFPLRQVPSDGRSFNLLMFPEVPDHIGNDLNV
jgi:FkbM family methyltransferase